MAKKCGCASQKCECSFANSSTVTVTGIGTTEDPFVVHRNLPLTVVDSSTLDLELDSTDTAMTLSAQAIGSGAQVFVYTTNATWVKPAGAKMARIMLVGGGGGGAGGAGGDGNYGVNTNISVPGGGGGGYTFATLIDTDIPSSAAIVVGTGGAGGIGSTGVGGTGGNGATSSFAGSLFAYGGNGGDYAALMGQGGNGLVKGGDGLTLMAPGISDVQAVQRLAPGGGGYGYRVYSGGPAVLGYPGAYSLPASGCRDASDVLSYGDGLDNLVSLMGSGGAGGYYPLSGHNGGLYGAGGGGGACAPSGSGSAGTNGGNGAHGVVVVVSW